MGYNNHHAGMHFVHYPRRISDIDDVSYHARKKEIMREKYEELMKYDKPCCLKLKNMKEEVRVNYFDKNHIDYSMDIYQIKNATGKKKRELTLWVGYDIGGRNEITGEIEKRGYYFYFTNYFERELRGRKLLLFEVERRSKTHMEQAIRISKRFGKAIVSNYYDGLEIDWQHPIHVRNGNKGPWILMENIRRFRTIKNCELVI